MHRISQARPIQSTTACHRCSTSTYHKHATFFPSALRQRNIHHGIMLQTSCPMPPGQQTCFFRSKAHSAGADGHYLSETDRQQAQLPIMRPSTKCVGIANGGSSTRKHVTQLPFDQLSKQATKADSFDDFPHSLMSVGKTADE